MIVLLIRALLAVGFLNALYLAYYSYFGKKLYCPLGEKCNEVIDSKYGRLFYFRNYNIGLVFYFILFFLSFRIELSLVYYFVLVASLLASLVSLFLLYVQVFVIRNYCLYCLFSAFVNLTVFTLLFFV